MKKLKRQRTLCGGSISRISTAFGFTIYNAFIFFSPSSALGTLRTTLETPVTVGTVPLYTSNSAGESDTFTLIYSVRVPENQPGGVYRARLIFTAEPVIAQAGVGTETVTMDVRVDLRGGFEWHIQNLRGGRTLEFNKITKEQQASETALKLSVRSNIGAPFRITQQVTEPLTSQEGEALEEEAIQYAVIKDGQNAGALTPLAVSASPLYSSDATGQGGEFEIRYALTPPSKQKAGRYSGVLTFKVESTSPLVPMEVINVRVSFEIDTIFDLDIQIERDASSLSFGTFRNVNDKQIRKVLISVQTNVGSAYQISQIVSRPLTNPEGSVIPKENFIYYGSDAQTGVLSTLSPTPVREGEAVIFTSDVKGTAGKFVMNYELAIPAAARAGSYQSDIKYSITTL